MRGQERRSLRVADAAKLHSPWPLGVLANNAKRPYLNYSWGDDVFIA